METNYIIQELNAIASLDVTGRQKAYFEQRARDARPVQCVPMRDVFTPEQLQFLFKNTGYKTQQKMCYRNAAQLVECAEWMAAHFDPGVSEIKYVEGLTYEPGLLPIEHAFVKIGDKYIDPTFERALHLDVTKCEYVALVELEWSELAAIQEKTGYYGEIYNYLFKQRMDAADKQ